MVAGVLSVVRETLNKNQTRLTIQGRNSMDLFIWAVAVVAVVFAYMCGISDGCKKNGCFRNEDKSK